MKNWIIAGLVAVFGAALVGCTTLEAPAENVTANSSPAEFCEEAVRLYAEETPVFARFEHETDCANPASYVYETPDENDQWIAKVTMQGILTSRSDCSVRFQFEHDGTLSMQSLPSSDCSESEDESPLPAQRASGAQGAVVEIRVWQSTGDASRLYISARPAGGSWSTLGTIPLGQGQASVYETTSNGRFRYSDIELLVPLR